MERNPDQTRRRLLEAAYEEIHQHGFQGMRIEDVLEKAALKKGAMYHHFENKLALGYAVVDEIIQGVIHNEWLEPLATEGDPLVTLQRRRDEFLAEMQCDEDFRLGCPLNNLAQEMSPIDEGFRQRIDALMNRWIDGMAAAFERGRQQGYLRDDVDSLKSATFVVAAIEGCIGLAKNRQSRAVFVNCSDGIVEYLQSLRRNN